MFIDRAKIILRSGSGGAGQISFRREKYIPRGGPHGGNGGKGGSIYIIGSSQRKTLLFYKYHKHFFAPNGGRGGSYNRTGAHGKDLYLEVPLGTRIILPNKQYFISEENKPILLVAGGRGGLGNLAFKSSTHQIPYKSLAPEPGKEMEIEMKLELMGDIGFVGLPNAGKSTLLNAMTRASAKVGNYAFTTLEPQLGTAGDLILVDLPGLIQDSSLGRGLGIRFLTHVTHCSYIAYVIECTSDILTTLQILQREIINFGIQKQHCLILTKAEKITSKEREKIKNFILEFHKEDVYFVSGMFNMGLNYCLKQLSKKIKKIKLMK